MTNNEGIIFINCPNCGESLEISSQQAEEICPICKSPLDIQTLAVAEPQPTRKDKIKELLGRNLNSYHAKAKQLLTDIEKKNKEQNHKISVLTNKLDNDYLTKTEEGSVISLDYSKEGMVYLDELQGNTMVNYCTDGSKELTLNGDIDIEGTFVTTTEGVDNGLVDVMCEGETLVNIFPTNIDLTNPDSNVAESLNYFSRIFPLLQNGKTYTAMFINSPTTIYQVYISACGIPWTNITNNKAVFTVNYESFDSSAPRNFQFMSTGITPIDELTNFKIIILEGDWTDKEIPPYFEGMKSVGQDDINGHKVEILSRNSHNEIVGSGIIEDLLINPNGDLANGGSADKFFSSDIFEEIEPNTQYYFWHSKDGVIQNDGQFIYFYDKDKKLINGRKERCTQLVSYPNAKYFKMMVNRGSGATTDIKFYVSKKSEKPTVIDSKTKLNKKEILLNEPLRSLPKVAKDNLIKLNNDWFVERKCGGALFNGEEVWNVFNANTIEEESCVFYTANKISNCVMNTVADGGLSLISNTFKCSETNATGTIECIQIYDNKLRVKLLKSKLNTVDVEGFKKWLADNPLEIVYQLATSTYEPLEIEPTLNTYNDVTHISNNSIIPCTMKVKNSGYNAIIKPSTLYTVALDINKSGTIGCNLGGAKGTTTNNVLTLTTPAILTDDSLRIYGKGIKALR